MATTMKSNNAAIAAMQQMLQERCIAEPAFAIKMAQPNKSMEGAVNHLCRIIQKSGLCVVDDKTVENILVDYFDEPNIEDGGTPINCNIVVSKQEQLRELRRQSQPKAQPKPTATAPKAGAEIDSIPNLFDEL